MKKQILIRRIMSLALALLLVGSLAVPARAHDVGYDGYAVAGRDFSVFLRKDGRVVSSGLEEKYSKKLENWENIVQLSADSHVVGLREDGTVVAAGLNDFGQCRVSDWEDIIQVAAGRSNTIGLRSDGTVVIAGDTLCNQHAASTWTNVIQVAAGGSSVYGLRSDGTVVVAGTGVYILDDFFDWKDIQSIAAGEEHVVGLKKDMTLVADGNNDYGQCDVSGWKDVISVDAGDYHTVGLTVYMNLEATGLNTSGQCKVSDFSYIRTVSAGGDQTLGVDMDSVVFHAGKKVKDMPKMLPMLAYPGGSLDYTDYLLLPTEYITAYIESAVWEVEMEYDKVEISEKMDYVTEFAFRDPAGGGVAGSVITDRQSPFMVTIWTLPRSMDDMKKEAYLGLFLKIANTLVYDGDKTGEGPEYEAVGKLAKKEGDYFYDIGDGFRVKLTVDTEVVSMVLYPKRYEKSIDFNDIWS